MGRMIWEWLADDRIAEVLLDVILAVVLAAVGTASLRSLVELL